MASPLYGLAGKLLGELCSPVLQDFVKSWGFGNKDEFEKLKNIVSAIEAMLLDAEEKQITNNQVRDSLVMIEHVFHDLKDLFLEIATESLKRKIMTKKIKAKEVHIFFSMSNQVLFRLKMGRKVKLIRERSEVIASDLNTLNLSEGRNEILTIKSPIREER